jgi:hypothetical protein
MSKKDKTAVGITGKPVPKPSTAKQQYELEKKRRLTKHLGKNVGGTQYSSDVNPYYNPRQRNFREFIEIAEGKKKDKKDKNIPVNAVPGTYKEHPDGSKEYVLKPLKPSKPLSKKQVFKMLAKQGGIGRKSVERGQKQQEAFSYGDTEYQDKIVKQKKEAKQKKRAEAQQRSADLYRERTQGRGIKAVHKGQSGWMKDGKFTPD